jgi:hypothetical protein
MLWASAQQIGASVGVALLNTIAAVVLLAAATAVGLLVTTGPPQQRE